jgi:hypothetical protein
MDFVANIRIHKQVKYLYYVIIVTYVNVSELSICTMNSLYLN